MGGVRVKVRVDESEEKSEECYLDINPRWRIELARRVL
jgi:hypothetical protein